MALLTQMMASDLRPTSFTFGPILSSPSLDQHHGHQLHPLILKCGLLQSDPYSGTALLGFFGRNGRLDDALKLFDEMPVKNVVTWNSLVLAFSQLGFVEDSMLLFRELMRTGICLSEYSIINILSAFSSIDSIQYVEQVHGVVIKTATDSFLFVLNSLLNVHCNYSGVHLGKRLFDEMLVRDVVSWNIVLAAFAKSGAPKKAVEHFLVMGFEGLLPNETTFSTVLNACSSLNEPEYGKLIHAKAIKHNYHTSAFAGSSLVDFYAKCVGQSDAYRLFNEIPEKNVVSWNVLIASYSYVDSSTPFVLLKELLCSEVRPNEFSFSSLIKHASVMDLGQIHSLVIRMGYDRNKYVSSAIVASYASHGILADALACGLTLDPLACNALTNVLAGIYNKFGRYQETKELLFQLPTLDTVSWSILFTACARSGDYLEAFNLFKQMQSLGYLFDNYMAVCLLSICSKINSLFLGKLLHGLIIKTNSGRSETFVNNVLLDMYVKCGSLKDCLKIFEEMEERNLISWTAVISGFGLHGSPHKALECFQQMEEEGFKPDKVALLAVLSACRHGGLVEEGMMLFNCMKAVYGVEPEIDHYICAVDLLCKHGHLKEAELLISSMHFQPNAVIWRIFLEGCKRYASIEA
ncbi:pentatricopeptide repeat-containing protein At3g58590-like [Typha latifolia]|uniref:pentatricopeptide repeat-containing protein At3g58590-like n=1 Tax=Typha latifolia TaxID=4733 RepID=UPI003C2B2AF3